VAATFLTAFGLRVERHASELLLRAGQSEHIWARIIKGDSKKRLVYVSFGCYVADFEALRAQVHAAGGIEAAPHPGAPADGFWFADVDGNLMQVRVAAKTMPDTKAPLFDENVPSGTRGALPRSEAPLFAPARLSHLALFSPNISRALDFHQRALGVLLSDRSRDLIAFTYGRHGSDHHLLAFLASPARGLHHSSWDMLGIGAIGSGAERLRCAGYSHQWGLGRHVLGSNYFTYTRDPWGQWWEHICHIDYIPKGMKWDGGDYDEEDGFYLWGPKTPNDFGINTEI
jgi:catechol 2,3-dioxygenase-like lactoylglutathione lyase family enzyme